MIIRDCKYRKIAGSIQHDRAKAFITNALRSGSPDQQALKDEGQRLHDMMSDTDFERETLDINGDFPIASGEMFSMDTLPETVKITGAPIEFKVNINGVEINPDIRFGVQRRNAAVSDH